MGCHLGSGQADGVPAHEPAHGGVLRRVPAVVPATLTCQGYVHDDGFKSSPRDDA
jgi:hypothetical protein